MEIFGILLSVPAAFIASTLYAFLVRWLTSIYPWSLSPTIAVSIAVLVGLVLEWCILGAVGAQRSVEVIGPVFYPLHLVVFFLSIPALANILTLRKPGGGLWRSLVVGLLCAALALPVVITHIAVSETLYGIDGSGGPIGS